MSDNVAYFGDWRARSYACECGWSGPSTDLGSEPFDELARYSCPKCDKRLVLVTYPTGDEIKEAAARGNEEAVTMLPQVMEREARQLAAEAHLERWRREAVRTPNELPNLAGEALSFVWDVGVVDGLAYFVIRHDGEVVCQEPAYEGTARFPEVRALFKQRYGARFGRLDITEEAKDYMIDPDSISSVLKADFEPT